MGGAIRVGGGHWEKTPTSRAVGSITQKQRRRESGESLEKRSFSHRDPRDAGRGERVGHAKGSEKRKIEIETGTHVDGWMDGWKRENE